MVGSTHREGAVGMITAGEDVFGEGASLRKRRSIKWGFNTGTGVVRARADGPSAGSSARA
jgi:hypothetical protein